MIKMTIVLRRHPSLTRDDFVAYHRGHHAALFSALPESILHVRRYVQVHAQHEELPGLPMLKADGLTEIWFDDLAGLAALFTSPAYLETIRPDEEKFLDLAACQIFIGNENEVMSP